MDEKESATQEKKGGNKKKIIISVCIAACVVVVCLVIYVVTHPKSGGKETITPDNVDERVEEMFASDDSNIPAYYTATQNSEWIFSDGSSVSGNAYVENVEDNETPVYFDLILDETGEVIYSSPVIEQGAKLDEIKLDKDLDKGEYVCTVEYHMVDEDQNTLTTANVGVTVVVEN